MIVYTGSFKNCNRYPNPFSVAGKTPDWFPGKTLSFLTPKYGWWKEWHDRNLGPDWYIDKYVETVLKPLLCQEKLMEHLSKLGEEQITLCCYEISPQPIDKQIQELDSKEFCHRHIISAWLRSGGYDSREYSL